MRLPAFISNRPAFGVAALCLMLPANVLRAGSLLETMDAEVSSLYEKSKDAIFKVHAESLPFFGSVTFGPTHRVGTGFFIDGEGRFVTAATLVENTTACWIDWRGQRVNARVLGLDPSTNLALLQVDAAKCMGESVPTPCLNLGDSESLRVGSMVVAVGFPYDLPSAPSLGVVTGLDIKCGARVFPVSYIRASCALRPGQGGGPMFNARGEVVGIIVAVPSDDQCFALPISAVQKVCADVAHYGEPQRGYVGLSVTERQPTTNSGWQVVVQEVASNSPAAIAGFRENDILLRICTNEIRRSADVLNKMFYLRCRESVRMTILRAGDTQEVSVVIGHRPSQSTATVRNLPAQMPAIQQAAPSVVPASAQSPK
jgi:serine protease Do